MKYAGFYINLDRSPDRRADIEGELARCGLESRYARFPASDGNSLNFPNPLPLKEGELGCFISHYRLLTENRNCTQPLHVIEDDVVLSPQMEGILDLVIDGGHLAKADIIFTDVSVPVSNALCPGYKAAYDTSVQRDAQGKIKKATFEILDMRELVFGATSSFLVNPQSVGKLASFYEEELRAGAALPIDLFIRKLCYEGKIRVHCVFPFVTSIRIESPSTIESRFEELPALAANMMRHSFYIGCDWAQCLEKVNRLFPQPDANDLHRQLMMRLLGYSLMPGYKRL
jgi:hypothetical protein